MGNPPSIHDSDITVKPPSQGDDGLTASTLGFHVQLSELLAEIVNSKFSLETDFGDKSNQAYL